MLDKIKGYLTTIVIVILGALAAFFAISSNRKDDKIRDEGLRADNAVDQNDKNRKHSEAADAVDELLVNNDNVEQYASKAKERQKAKEVDDIPEDALFDHLNRGE